MSSGRCWFICHSALGYHLIHHCVHYLRLFWRRFRAFQTTVVCLIPTLIIFKVEYNKELVKEKLISRTQKFVNLAGTKKVSVLFYEFLKILISLKIILNPLPGLRARFLMAPRGLFLWWLQATNHSFLGTSRCWSAVQLLLSGHYQHDEDVKLRRRSL